MSDLVSGVLTRLDEIEHRGPYPDEVLRLCRAHRQIVELHAPEEPYSGAGRLQCAHCASLCHSETGLGCELGGDAPFPCETLRLLAVGLGVVEEDR